MGSVQSTESSVLFNLRQLMQLESERVEAEEVAERERVATAEREREAVARARVEEARRESLEALRLEREREAALLRAQLTAAADERVRREGLELEHAREVRVIEARVRRSRAAIVSAGLAFTLIGGVGAHAWLSAPRLVHSESSAPIPMPATLHADQESELASLRERLAKLTEIREADPQTTIAPATPTPKRRIEAKHSRGLIRAPRPNTPDRDPLAPIDTNDSDPLQGM